MIEKAAASGVDHVFLDLEDAVAPSAKRVAEIERQVTSLGARCVFAEPQFNPKLVDVVARGGKAKAAVLDPLGSTIKDGPDLYFTLMRSMASSMKDCLSPSS